MIHPITALVVFLRDKFTERENLAKLATEGDGYLNWTVPTTGIVAVAGGDLDGLVPAPRWAAHHMADNDPAYVLADVEAKRSIVDRCAAIALDTTADPAAVLLAEATLRDMARPFAGCEGYRPEWRP